jgi:hypothetical protein
VLLIYGRRRDDADEPAPDAGNGAGGEPDEADDEALGEHEADGEDDDVDAFADLAAIPETDEVIQPAEDPTSARSSIPPVE